MYFLACFFFFLHNRFSFIQQPYMKAAKKRLTSIAGELHWINLCNFAFLLAFSPIAANRWYQLEFFNFTVFKKRYTSAKLHKKCTLQDFKCNFD